MMGTAGPQGLKPIRPGARYGTTEVVPFPSVAFSSMAFSSVPSLIVFFLNVFFPVRLFLKGPVLHTVLSNAGFLGTFLKGNCEAREQ
jgi:hypothetical protein